MEFSEYQSETAPTAVYPDAGEKTGRAIRYVVCGLAGEAGELCNVSKKLLRDPDDIERLSATLVDEIGDVLWYCARALLEVDHPITMTLTGLNPEGRMAISGMIGRVGRPDTLVEAAIEAAGIAGRITEAYRAGSTYGVAQLAIAMIEGLGAMAYACGTTIDQVAARNLAKLADRQANGTVHGHQRN